MCWDLNRPFDVGSRESKNFDTFQQLVMLCKRAGGGADAAGGRAAYRHGRWIAGPPLANVRHHGLLCKPQGLLPWLHHMPSNAL